MGTKDDYARAIIAEGRRQGIQPKGIVIGLAVPFVECDYLLPANPKVPESLKYPHDRLGTDGLSVGLYQQQIVKGDNGRWWWADVATCMDPTGSARLFFERLKKWRYWEDDVSPGWYAQEIQDSAYPDRYDKRMGEAQALYDRLSASTDSGGPAMPAIDYGITKVMHGYNADSIGTGNSDGVRGSTLNVTVHTQEAESDAIELADFCNTHEVAYNVAVDDVNTIEIVPMNEAPWAAAGANAIAWHLCFAGSFAGWSEGRWLSTDASDGLNEDAMLWRGAKAAAAACQQFGVPAVFVGDGNKAGPNSWPTRRGIVGHRDFGTRGGGHSDPGNGFPMTEFVRRVNTFLNPTAPPPAPGGKLKSLVDGTEHTTEEFILFADYHSWRADKLATALAQKAGIPTDDESLKKVK